MSRRSPPRRQRERIRISALMPRPPPLWRLARLGRRRNWSRSTWPCTARTRGWPGRGRSRPARRARRARRSPPTSDRSARRALRRLACGDPRGGRVLRAPARPSGPTPRPARDLAGAADSRGRRRARAFVGDHGSAQGEAQRRGGSRRRIECLQPRGDDRRQRDGDRSRPRPPRVACRRGRRRRGRAAPGGGLDRRLASSGRGGRDHRSRGDPLRDRARRPDEPAERVHRDPARATGPRLGTTLGDAQQQHDQPRRRNRDPRARALSRQLLGTRSVRPRVADRDDARGSRAAHPWSGPGRRSTDGRALPGLPWGPDWVRPVILAHLDLDAFFAAVEELEQPELRSKPLVVGGDPHGRGVVATANYEARKFGIHSAMAAAEALRRCPHAVFVRPRHRLYREYSQAVWTVVREVVPTVERTGLDEGYLDIGEVADDFSRARAVAEAVQAAVRGATSLSCSLGVARSKVVAKIASDRRKPGGLCVVPAGREAEFLGPFDVRRLPGVGPRSEEKLRRAGVETIGALAALDDGALRRLLPGKLGPLLRDRACGIDPPPLQLSSETVSVSAEETFERDIEDVERLREELRRLSGHVAERLGGQTGRTVTTKVRYPDFSIRSRSTSLPVGIDNPERIWELACSCLDRALADRPGALRLLGVAVSGLEAHRQLELV